MLAPDDDPLRSASASPEHPHPAVPHSSRSPLSSRGPSLDLANSSVRSDSLDSQNDPYRGRSSFESNPFRDPSLDWVSPPSSSIHHPRSRDASIDGAERSLSPSVASSIHSAEELERELADAVSLELPRVSEESSWDGEEGWRRDRSGTVTASTSSTDVRRGSRGEGGKGGAAKPGSLLYQFRTGSGWFAPLAPPTPPPTREARQQAEKERIEKLKEGKSASRRPGLMKRMSSGVEMTFGSSSAARARSGSGVSLSGFGGGGGGSGVGGRERSGSSATIVPK
ncbi:proteophosphoglycan ppg4 [Rhodotorula toruloides]|uniref:Proteophosphoglycan ppg4 n=1 Tax=Rhodotorula toruloides TaxID=5286 RepID=A0A511KLE0_RHOTO|nr:proteophosphoglycan ppg4 [Rhodotorula toruloides]